MDDVTLVSEMISWVKEKLQEDFPDVKAGFNETFSYITTLYLYQSLLNLSMEHEQDKKAIIDNTESIKSLTAQLKAKDEELNNLKEHCLAVENNKHILEKQLSSKKEEVGLANIKDKITEMDGLLSDEEKVLNDFSYKLLSTHKPLKKLAPIILESMSRIVANWENNEICSKNGHSNLRKEKAKVDDKYKAMYCEYNSLLREYNQDRAAQEEKNYFFAKKIQELADENNVLLAKLAERGSKISESLGDYEKRENYQIAKEYKEFCLRQGMEFLAEEIVSYNQKKRKKPYDGDKYLKQMLKTKVMLSNKLLVNTYKMQAKKVRTGKTIGDFENFKDNNINHVLLELKLPEHMSNNLVIIAEKAFNLINELISLTPACQLLLPERGERFSSDEHDIDTIYCEPEGIIKFTVVPGISTGHKILMKPIVFTEPI